MNEKKRPRKIKIQTGPFIRVPEDIHELILDFITSPSDLIALGLVRKKLLDIVIPRLYREVSLTPKTTGYPFYNGEGFFTPGNRGHPFVRKIHFDFEKKKHSHGQRMIEKTLNRLLSPDQLSTFSAPNLPCHQNLFLALVRRQRQLRELCLGPLNFDQVPPSADPSLRVEDWLSQLKILDIPKRVGSSDDLVMYRNIIEKANLSELRINCPWPRLNGRQQWKEEGDFDWGPQSLFGHFVIGGKRPKGLDRLTLKTQDQGETGQAYTACIDFTTLQYLEVCNCENSEKLLTFLAPRFRAHTPRLTHLTLDLFWTNATCFESFFKSFSGLKLLRIKARLAMPTWTPQDPFDAECLATHAATLKTFSISSFWDDLDEPCTASKEFITWIASHCLCLEQIGIALSTEDLEMGNVGLFGDFGYEVELLFRLPRLRILRILNMPKAYSDLFVPNPHGSPNVRDKERVIYKLGLDGFATMLMRCKGKDKLWHQLPLLCFGNYSRNMVGFGNYSYDQTPICYAPAGNIDLLGNVTAQALRIPIHHALSLEPHTDHLFREYEPSKSTLLLTI